VTAHSLTWHVKNKLVQSITANDGGKQFFQQMAHQLGAAAGAIGMLNTRMERMETAMARYRHPEVSGSTEPVDNRVSDLVEELTSYRVDLSSQLNLLEGQLRTALRETKDAEKKVEDTSRKVDRIVRIQGNSDAHIVEVVKGALADLTTKKVGVPAMSGMAGMLESEVQTMKSDLEALRLELQGSAELSKTEKRSIGFQVLEREVSEMRAASERLSCETASMRKEASEQVQGLETLLDHLNQTLETHGDTIIEHEEKISSLSVAASKRDGPDNSSLGMPQELMIALDGKASKEDMRIGIEQVQIYAKDQIAESKETTNFEVKDEGNSLCPRLHARELLALRTQKVGVIQNIFRWRI